MSAKKGRPGRVVVAGAVKSGDRRKGEFLYVDREGNIRAMSPSRGGQRGHRTCREGKR